MIPELGQALLLSALVIALWQGVCLFAGPVAKMEQMKQTRVLRFASCSLFAAVAASFLLLTFAYATSDFSVMNVEENSHSAMPLFYKITGVWGNHEGSMILWISVLALYGTVFRLMKMPEDARGLQNMATALHGLLMAAFILYISFTSNPFLRLDPPALEGEELNPLLQDVGLAFHPPFLYLGYVGFGMAYLIGVAALIRPVANKKLAEILYPWVVVPWALLTFGIGLGSWWAYRELGWGGWWFWDPVENASLMPWLAGTALLHSLFILRKRGLLYGWVLLLSVLTFLFSLLGTFLVRSGIITSVHSFASDPTRGLFILALLVLVGGGALGLYAAKSARQPKADFSALSREGSVLAQNILMLTLLATVCLGTLYPIFMQLLDLDSITVGGPYFYRTFTPVLVIALLLMGAAFSLRWQKDAGARVARVLLPLLAVAAVATGAGYVLGVAKWSILLAIFLSSWTLAGLAVSARREVKAGSFTLARAGGYVSHFGVAVLCLAITTNLQLKQELSFELTPGKTMEQGGAALTLQSLSAIKTHTYVALRAPVRLELGGREYWLKPELRSYPVRGDQTAETAIAVTPARDIYLVLRKHDFAKDYREGKMPASFLFTLYINPAMVWLWAGILLAGAGGLIALAGRMMNGLDTLRKPAETA